VFPLNLYARVRILDAHFAHETAGAASTRSSLLPCLEGEEFQQSSGATGRGNANVYLNVIAKRLPASGRPDDKLSDQAIHASRSLSSGAHSLDPLTRHDGSYQVDR